MGRQLSQMAAILSPSSLTCSILLFILAIWTQRIFWIRRFNKINPPLISSKLMLSNLPKISIIVPARNEENNIIHCLQHLLAQTYPNFEIIVVNDRSSDKTHEILAGFQKKMPEIFKIVTIESLPSGWTGKNNGMFQGAKAASGPWLLFTDADTLHKPYSVQTAVEKVLSNKIDFLTLAPEVLCKTFWESTVQPLVIGSLALWFRSEKVNNPDGEVTLANGQFILVKKEAYDKIGGNESVKNEVIEDVELAKKVKAAGYVVKFFNGTLLYSTRMYNSLKEILTGWTRIFTYLFEKNIFSIVMKILSLILFSLVPFALLILQLLYLSFASQYFDKNIFILSCIVSGYISLIRFMGNKMLQCNPWYGFLHALGCCVTIWILLKCLVRIIFNRPSVWRGDYYK
jgi:chlorobactene glucosyltransferase